MSLLPSLKSLKDHELLSATKSLAQRERSLQMQVLRHLAEIERRKLYCDLKYGSLFEYAVAELGYSEGSASRRIQAMRLLKEIPEVAPKIESGALNLSNISQAQSFFREQKKAQPERPLNKEEKQQVLERLEQKSAREGQRILCAIGGPAALPRERERIVSPEHIEVSFVLNQELKNQLAEVRALLGPKGGHLSLAELVAEMARLSAERLAEQRFGKQRMRAARVADAAVARHSDVGVDGAPDTNVSKAASDTANRVPEVEISAGGVSAARPRSRYVAAAVKHQTWQRAGGRCQNCGSRHDLEFDHVEPFALGGDSTKNNIQLLCRACNVRRGVQTFGSHALRRP